MSDDAFEWKLTPTERRVAEAAFASAPMREWSGGAVRHDYYAAACASWKVLMLRNEHREMPSEEVRAMLAELRCEPAPVCSQRVVSTSFASAREGRYRALLDRIVAEADSATIDDAPSATSRWQPLLKAIYEASKELGR